jgi:hypothetical protein
MIKRFFSARIPRIPPKIGWAVLVIFVLGVNLYGAFSTPLNFDEVEFVSAGEGYHRTGQPSFQLGLPPAGEIERSPDLFFGPEKAFQWGLWHTSYLVPLLGKIDGILGLRNWTSRLPGLLCFFLGWLFLLRLKKNDKDFNRFFTILYFTIPVLVHQGLAVDMDNTLGTLALVTCVFLHFRYQAFRESWRLFALSAVSFFLLAWSKEFMVVYWIPALFLYLVITKKFRSIPVAAAGGLLGLAVFAGTWGLWNQSMGTDPLYFLKFSILRRAKGGGLGDALSILREGGVRALVEMWMRSWALAWVHLDWSFWILLGFALRLNRRTMKEGGPELLVPLLVITIAAVTLIARPTFISFRYVYPLIPFGVWMMARRFSSGFDKTHWKWVIQWTAVLALVRIFLCGDPLFFYVRSEFDLRQIARFAAVTLALWGLASYLFWKFPKRKTELLSPFQKVLLVSFFSFNLAQTYFQRGTYMTAVNATRNYGESGLDTIARDLRVLVDRAPGAMVFCRKDVGFHAFHMQGEPERIWKGSWAYENAAFQQQILQRDDVLVVGDRYTTPVILYSMNAFGLRLLVDRRDFTIFGKGKNF